LRKKDKEIVMKKRVLILVIIIMPFACGLKAQKVLTLKECYDLAVAATPIAAEIEAYSQISAVRDKNLSKSWLPSTPAR
jgi:hypothetical protein